MPSLKINNVFCKMPYRTALLRATSYNNSLSYASLIFMLTKKKEEKHKTILNFMLAVYS